MKRLMLILVAVAFFAGCAAAERSEFFQHDTMYRDGDHLWYSWHKYKTTDNNDMKKSQAENWWGETVRIDKNQVASK
ncbi:MAG: hypothetical protein ABFD62_07640 [Syntrophaceae bacterium]